MKTSAVILGLIGVAMAYLYFTSEKGYSKVNPYEKPVEGKIIFTDRTDTPVTSQDSLPQPPDINIILPKGN